MNVTRSLCQYVRENLVWSAALFMVDANTEGVDGPLRKPALANLGIERMEVGHCGTCPHPQQNTTHYALAG